MLSHAVRSAAGLSANGVMIAFYYVKRSHNDSISFLNIEDTICLHLRGKRRMSVKNEAARILRAHAERAASANVLEKFISNSIVEVFIKVVK